MAVSVASFSGLASCVDLEPALFDEFVDLILPVVQCTGAHGSDDFRDAGRIGRVSRDPGFQNDAGRRVADLDAVAKENLYFVPPSLIQRPTPRLLEGAQLLCDKLDQARQKREDA